MAHRPRTPRILEGVDLAERGHLCRQFRSGVSHVPFKGQRHPIGSKGKEQHLAKVFGKASLKRITGSDFKG